MVSSINNSDLSLKFLQITIKFCYNYIIIISYSYADSFVSYIWQNNERKIYYSWYNLIVINQKNLKLQVLIDLRVKLILAKPTIRLTLRKQNSFLVKIFLKMKLKHLSKNLTRLQDQLKLNIINKKGQLNLNFQSTIKSTFQTYKNNSSVPKKNFFKRINKYNNMHY